VNFVQLLDDHLFVRTYERGVEEETLSCGTGVTASAIAAGLKFNRNDWNIETLGGKFKVDFEIENKFIREVWLRGPAEMICWGETIVR
jgi:diaminopimelate epimerase